MQAMTKAELRWWRWLVIKEEGESSGSEEDLWPEGFDFPGKVSQNKKNNEEEDDEEEEEAEENKENLTDQLPESIEVEEGIAPAKSSKRKKRKKKIKNLEGEENKENLVEEKEKEKEEENKENISEKLSERVKVEEPTAPAKASKKKKKKRKKVEEQSQRDGMREIGARRSSEDKLQNIGAIAETAVRGNMSAEVGAALANAFLMTADLIQSGRAKLISEEALQRAMDAVPRKPKKLSPPVVEAEEEEEETPITCLLFGVRCDLTRIIPKEDEADGDYVAAVRSERHVTLTSEPGSAYVSHLGPADYSRYADTEDLGSTAAAIYNFLHWRGGGIDKTLVYFGGVGGGNGVGGVDGRGEVAHFLEQRLGRRLVRIVCELDSNDLSLRDVIEELAGPYSGKNPGKLWQMVLAEYARSFTPRKFEFDADFEPLVPPFPLRDIPGEVLDGLPSDQAFAYRIAKMITTGVVDRDIVESDVRDFLDLDLSDLDVPNAGFADLDFPPSDRADGGGGGGSGGGGGGCGGTPDDSDSRWLTAASLFARLWVSKHGLAGDDLATLRAVVQFVVGVYVVLRFEIHADASLVGGPRRKLREVQILRRLKAKNAKSKKAKKAAMRAAEKRAWHAHSEHVLLALLASDDADDRRFALTKIKAIRLRRNSNAGDVSPRLYFPPRLNWDATSIRDLLPDWTLATEPFVTASMTDKQLGSISKTPLSLPEIPAHARGCLRCAERVCLASDRVVGPSQRDDYVRASGKSLPLTLRF